ncbi:MULTISPECIES: MFS transporter [unclassified Acinetobacter]|uniref:MFS transporter n=1 Tax=unclassified Acinetobacter TaxID=196816 RepID=UPI0035B89AF0
MNRLEIQSTFALASIFALRMLGLFMIIPVFAVAGQQYTSATPFLLGFAIGIYGLTQAVFQIPFSLWADRYQRKWLIIIGLILFAVGGAIAALSTSIYGVIIGRAIAGAGAVSAVVMALLSDVTREEQRSKAMAMIGMSIGLSFMLAFGLGPFVTAKIGLSGLFWLTTVMAIVAMFMLFLVPNVQRHHRQIRQSYRTQLAEVLKMPDLNRLHISIFVLHLLLTAMFVYIPSQLMTYADIPLDKQGWVYLPLMVVSLFFAFPSIILAEKYRKMREIFLVAVLCIVIGLAVMAFAQSYHYALLVGVAFFFISFNVMEALLPSWLSKAAPLQSKSTAMGINSSSQFLGSFFGGSLGGMLLHLNNTTLGWSLLAGIAIMWLLGMLQIRQPRYLSSVVVQLPTVAQDLNVWSDNILEIEGIEEIVILADKGVAYLKLDKKQLDENARHRLSQLLQQELAF